MQSEEYAYAFHDAPPSELPKDGWKRQEVHDLIEAHVLGKRLESEVRAQGYPRKDCFAVALVFREAIANSLRHGNRGDQTRSVLVSYHVSAMEVLLEVADEGFGFNPYHVLDPFAVVERFERSSGRGLLLMRVYSSWVRFNRRGNRITICKRRSEP